MLENSHLRDEIRLAMRRAREMSNDLGMTGFGTVTLWTPDEVKAVVPFTNLITTQGDEYYAKRAIQGVSPNNYSYTTEVTGMKLGTGSTAVHKSTANAANISSGTYISGSNNVFDSGYPQAAAVAGTDTGWYAIYQTTWAAGDATNSAITEAAIVYDQSSDAYSTAANTVSRVTFTAVNKTASDALTITWNHKLLGS